LCICTSRYVSVVSLPRFGENPWFGLPLIVLSFNGRHDLYLGICAPIKESVRLISNPTPNVGEANKAKAEGYSPESFPRTGSPLACRMTSHYDRECLLGLWLGLGDVTVSASRGRCLVTVWNLGVCPEFSRSRSTDYRLTLTRNHLDRRQLRD
jgi:hypothetical protein